MSEVTLCPGCLWSSGGAGSGTATAELNPTSQTDMDHFLCGSGRYYFRRRGATWFCWQLNASHFLSGGREGLKVFLS